MAKRTIGKKTERRVVWIEDGRVNLIPMSDTLKWCDGFGRFTALVTPLQECIAWMFRFTKRLFEKFNEVLSVLHPGPYHSFL